jgi:Dirigent-like protein
MNRRRKLALIAVSAMIVCGAGAAIAVASGKGELTKPKTIHVEAVGGKFALLPLNPDKKTFFGNQIVISAPVFKATGHDKVGHLHAVCTFMDKPGIAAECTITTFLRPGDIVVHGLIDFGQKNHTTGAIIGGTEEFRNARGQVVFENSPGSTEGFIFQLEP